MAAGQQPDRTICALGILLPTVLPSCFPRPSPVVGGVMVAIDVASINPLIQRTCAILTADIADDAPAEIAVDLDATIGNAQLERCGTIVARSGSDDY